MAIRNPLARRLVLNAIKRHGYRGLAPASSAFSTSSPHPTPAASKRGILDGSPKLNTFPLHSPWSRMMSTTGGMIPELSDPEMQKAMKLLFAINWWVIDDDTRSFVEKALAKKSDGYDALLNAYRAALAVDQFSGMLNNLKFQLDNLCGVTGENTVKVPEKLEKALELAYERYVNYLSSFKEDEVYLKKKVEMELGSMMMLCKQRCSNLGAKWGDISLLGTSGLSGSYIEQREGI